MDMYLGEDGSPLRAIETSYVFEERDEPLTLGAWLSMATPKDAAAVLERFLLISMRPWLAHVRRDRIDLRTEYPVLRPAPAPGKQSPENFARSELDRLQTPEVTAVMGFEVDSKSRVLPPEHMTQVPQLCQTQVALAKTGIEMINPAWVCGEVAELGTGELGWLVDSLRVGLRDYDTLLTLTHGDLHLDNVLCTSAGDGPPRTVLIDFESAHYGHVCKDVARVEASLLCQLFDLDAEESDMLVSWFVSNTAPPASLLASSPIGMADNEHLHTVTRLVKDVRRIGQGCGQQHWPLQADEYRLAVLGSLLPMTRYTTLTAGQRRTAFCLAAAAASSFVHSSAQLDRSGGSN